jgi:hypothetical protein
MPVSSTASRAAAHSRSSPASRNPPGRPMEPSPSARRARSSRRNRLGRSRRRRSGTDPCPSAVIGFLGGLLLHQVGVEPVASELAQESMVGAGQSVPPGGPCSPARRVEVHTAGEVVPRTRWRARTVIVDRHIVPLGEPVRGIRWWRRGCCRSGRCVGAGRSWRPARVMHLGDPGLIVIAGVVERRDRDALIQIALHAGLTSTGRRWCSPPASTASLSMTASMI